MPLQNYKGYTVDYRLRQFRLVPPDFGMIEFIDFKSDAGDTLLTEMIRGGFVPADKMHYCM